MPKPIAINDYIIHNKYINCKIAYIYYIIADEPIDFFDIDEIKISLIHINKQDNLNEYQNFNDWIIGHKVKQTDIYDNKFNQLVANDIDNINFKNADNYFISIDGILLQHSHQANTLIYQTDEIKLMLDAIDKFWSHYDLNNPDISKAYTKREIVEWLKKEANNRGFNLSDNLANAMDTIMRCPVARKGGNSL